MATSAYLRAANQPPPLEGYDLFSQDRPLVDALRREGRAAREQECAEFGRLCCGEPLELGRLANENPPLLSASGRSPGSYVRLARSGSHSAASAPG